MSVLTLVLVHGALLTSNAWMPVQNYLQNHGYNVVTLDIPGRGEDGLSPQAVTLQLAADKVCSIVKLQAGKVLLIGHSQSGAVITQASSQCGSHIAGLVYVAAVVPLSGEKAFDLLSQQDGENFDKVAALDATSGLYRINYQGPIKEMFMADASDATFRQAVSNMVDEPSKLGDEPLHYNESDFSAIPKYYIQTQDDKIISLMTQIKYISRTKFTKVITMTTSHSPFVSQPVLLGKHLASIHDDLIVRHN